MYMVLIWPLLFPCITVGTHLHCQPVELHQRLFQPVGDPQPLLMARDPGAPPVTLPPTPPPPVAPIPPAGGGGPPWEVVGEGTPPAGKEFNYLSACK